MCRPTKTSDLSGMTGMNKIKSNSTAETDLSGTSNRHEGEHQHESVWKLLGCTVGICGCYMTYGIIQEHLFINSNSMGATFVLLLQCIFNAVVAKVILYLRPLSMEEQSQQLSHTTLLKTSACFTAAMLCSNEALQYVSYPTAVLAKSCKLLPTMLIRYITSSMSSTSSGNTMTQEWIGVILITTGVVLFNISRLTSSTPKSNGKEDSPFGLALLVSSLAMDGLLSFYQSKLKIMDETKNMRTPTALENMFWSNWYSIFFFGPLAVIMGQWDSGIQALPDYWKPILLINIMAALGQIFIHYTIYWFSPLMCNTITTTRKFFTILFSVYKFGHVITYTQWFCIAFVFSGIYAQIGSKYYNQKQQQKQKQT